MRLRFSLYLFWCAQLLVTSAFSQNRVSLDLSSTPLHSIIQQIEVQTNYTFIYNNDEINEYLEVDIMIQDEDILKVLPKIFDNLAITYQIKNNLIVLSRKRDKNTNHKLAHYSINGTIRNAATGETLLGSTILAKEENKGVVSNEYGFYSITLPEKVYTFQFSYIGYETTELKIELTENQKINVDLIPASNELEEIIIASENTGKSQVKTIIPGVSNLKSEDVKKLPSLLGEADITRAFLTQPGILSVGEGATGFNVRGGNIDQNLILLDEAPIYNSSHLWGFFSIFNADAIKDIKLYKGVIPSRFGGRASSVMDIRQKEGSNKIFKGDGGLGLLFSRLTLEGPVIKEKVSLLASGRRSYFDLFFPLLGGDQRNWKMHFYDLNTKITWNINENNKLFVSGYFGSDVMRLDFDEDPNPDGSLPPEEKIDFKWKNTTATIRWNHIFSNKLFMNISGIYSKYDYYFSSQNNAGGPINTSGSFTWKSAVENWIVKPDFTWYKNTDIKIRFGINNTLYRFTPAIVKTLEEGINNLNFETEKGLEIAPYIEYIRKWEKISLNAGLRYSWFGNIGPYSVSNYDPSLPKSVHTITETVSYNKGKIIKNYSNIEPRLSVKYSLARRKALKLGYNRSFQYIHLISNTSAALPFDIWKPSGIHIKPLEVNQVSTEYAYDTPTKVYNFSIGGYYKTFKNLLEYKNGADLFLNDNLETQLLPAKGYAYGAEFSLYKNKGKLNGYINYTYAITKRKTTSIFNSENINNGNYYPSNYDRPHVVNLNTNLKLGKKWDFSMLFTYQTGRPTTLPSGKIIIDNTTSFLTYSNRNQQRINDTHRIDISFTYTPKKRNKKWKGSWSFGIYNIYGRKNAFSQYSSFNNNQLKTFQFSVIGSPIPFFTYNFKF